MLKYNKIYFILTLILLLPVFEYFSQAQANGDNFGNDRWQLVGIPGAPIEEMPTRAELSNLNLIIHPSQPEYQYIVLDEYGLLVSHDGGTTWTNIYYDIESLGIQRPVITQVAVNPTNANDVYAIINSNLYYSDNSGVSWYPTNIAAEAVKVSEDGNILYVVNRDGIAYSKDKGATFSFGLEDLSAVQDVDFFFQVEIMVDAIDTNIAYVRINNSLFVTESAGKEWSLPPFLSSVQITQIITDQQVGDLAYVLTSEYAVYRTTNGGTAWGVVSDLSQYDVELTDYYRIVAAIGGRLYFYGNDTYSNRDLYCATGVFASNDQGISWETLVLFPPLNIEYASYDCFRLAEFEVHPDDTNLIDAFVAYSEGDIARIRSYDGGVTWDFLITDKPQKISVNQDGNTIYAISRYSAIASSDGGNTWTNIVDSTINFQQGDFAETPFIYFDITQSPDNNQSVHLVAMLGDSFASQFFIFLSLNAGDSWKLIHSSEATDSYGYPIRTIQRIETNPFNAEQLFLIEPNLVSTSRGTSWSQLPTVNEKLLYVVRVSPHAPEHIFFGVLEDGLFFSPDAGATVSPRGFGKDFSVIDIAFDPVNPQTIFALAEVNDQFSLYRSDDDGISWLPISEGLQENTLRIFVNPIDNNRLYMATQNEVFLSIDGGISWENFSVGLTPNQEFTDFEIVSSNPPMLYMTGNSGIWKRVLGDTSAN